MLAAQGLCEPWVHQQGSDRCCTCRIVDLSHDQDSTDLMKCLACAQREAAQLWPPGAPGQPLVTVLVLGTTIALFGLGKLARQQLTSSAGWQAPLEGGWTTR